MLRWLSLYFWSYQDLKTLDADLHHETHHNACKEAITGYCHCHGPNLAERARISDVNLDDYQLDPVTPPPSPSSPFSMAAYQRMIAETDPTRREETLTAYGTETDMDRYPNACLEELEAFLTLWDVKLRVEESLLETLSMDELITQLRQVCEDAEDHASNAQEEARQKRKEALEEVVQRIYRNN
ncbi:hypothetical protein Tco_1484650 [Tanacetum coccineum]